MPTNDNPYKIEQQFTEAITPQSYGPPAPTPPQSGTKGQNRVGGIASIADKFLAGVSRGRAVAFQRQQQERGNLMQDVNRQYASLEQQKDDLTPEAYKQAKSQLDALHVLAVKTAVDESENKSNPVVKGLKNIFEGIVGPGGKKFQLGPEQIYKTLYGVNQISSDPKNSRSAAQEQTTAAANQAVSKYQQDHPEEKITEETLYKIPEFNKAYQRATTLNNGNPPAWPILELAKANTTERREVNVAKARQEVVEANKKSNQQQEEIKNIPGSALPPGTKDAFGNATDPKAIYTRGKDNKLYPEAAPPKTEKEPSEAEKTTQLGQDLYRQNHNLHKDAKLDAKQQAAARKEYKESQETDEAKMARASLEASRALTEIVKKKELGDQPTAEDAKLIAQQVTSHRMAPEQMASLVGGFGAQAAAFKRMVLREALKIDPDFNFEQASAEYGLVKSPAFQNTIRYMDSVQESIPLVIKRANELSNTDVRFVNGLTNLTKRQLSDPTLKKFQTDALLVSDEIAKILQGGGTGNGTSDAKLKQAGEIINTADSPKAVAAALDDVKELLGYRRTALTRGTYLERKSAQADDTQTPPMAQGGSMATPPPRAGSTPPKSYQSPGVSTNTSQAAPPKAKLPAPQKGQEGRQVITKSEAQAFLDATKDKDHPNGDPAKARKMATDAKFVVQ